MISERERRVKSTYARLLKKCEEMRFLLVRLVLADPHHPDIPVLVDSIHDAESRLFDAYYKICEKYGFIYMTRPDYYRA